MAVEPAWQSNYVDLCDERTVRFGAQCVICDARYATPGESFDKLLVREAIPDRELQQEMQNAKLYVFTEFHASYTGILINCYRCQRMACPDCWDDDNQMCGECVAARGLVRSPRRGLPSSSPLADGRLQRVEPGRHSDAQRPTWLNTLLATQPSDVPLGTPPKQPAVKPRPAEEPAPRIVSDGALYGTSSPGAAEAGTPYAGTSFPGSPSSAAMERAAQTSYPGNVSYPDNVSHPGSSMEHAAPASYPGNAVAPEQPSVNMFSTSQAGAFSVPAAQFSPFSAPPAPAAPEMPSEPWGYADAGAMPVAETDAAGMASRRESRSTSPKVECPRCGTSNYDFVTRCTNCQLQLIQNCPRCQQLNPGHAAQCEFCGATLTPAPGWSQVNMPAISRLQEQTRGRGKNASDTPRRAPKVKKDERAERQRPPDHHSPAAASGGQSTDGTLAASQQTLGPFEVRGGLLVDYMEAHPALAALTLWVERFLTMLVVIFVVALLSAVAAAELSVRANDTLRILFHLDIRQILAQFITEMQMLVQHLKR